MLWTRSFESTYSCMFHASFSLIVADKSIVIALTLSEFDMARNTKAPRPPSRSQ